MRSQFRLSFMLALLAAAFLAVTASAWATNPPAISASSNQAGTYVTYALDSSASLPYAIVLYRANGYTTTGQFVAVDTISQPNSLYDSFMALGLTPGNNYTFYIRAFYSNQALQSNYAMVTVAGASLPTIMLQQMQGATTIRVNYKLDSTLGTPAAIMLFEAYNSQNFTSVDTIFPTNGYSGYFTRTNRAPGTYYYYIVVDYSNSTKQSSTQSITLNTPGPSITFTSSIPASNTLIGLGSLFTYDADAVASNSETVHYRLNYAVDSMQQSIGDASIDSVTGLLSIIPNRSGRFTVSITAYGTVTPQLTKTMTFTLTVTACASGNEPRIVGRLVDGDGNGIPVAAAWVYITRVNPTTGAALKTTTASITNGGYYTFTATEPGSYQVSTGSWNYVNMWYPNAWLPRDASTITLSCGDTAVANFTLNARPDSGWVTVQGAVTAQSSGKGVFGRVTFYGFDNSVPDSVRWERRIVRGPTFSRGDSAGVNGGYSVSLEKGYTWIGYGESYGNQGTTADTLLPQYYDGVGNPAAASAIPMTSSPVTVNFTLPTRPSYNNSISGTVQDYNGAAVESRVVAFPLSNYGIIDRNARSAFIDSGNGNYSISSLPPGDYVMWALPWDNDYAPGYLKSGDFAALSWRDATVLTVTATSELSGNTIKLRRSNGDDGTASLRGVARGTPGSNIKKDDGIASAAPAVAGALALVTNDKDEVIAFDLTDTDGNFQVNGVGNSSYTLIIDKVGFQKYSQTVTVKDGEVSNLGDIELSPLSTSSVPATGAALVAEASLYPNPVGTSATLRFTATSGSTTVRVIDATGTVIRTEQVNTVTGANTLTVDTQGMAAGLYMISLQSGSSSVILPMTVVR